MANMTVSSLTTGAFLSLGAALLLKRFVNALATSRIQAANRELSRHDGLIQDFRARAGMPQSINALTTADFYPFKI